MKLKIVCILLVCLIIYPKIIFSDDQIFVWFDTNGALRSEDPIVYFNSVISNKSHDPELENLIESVIGQKKSQITNDDIQTLSDYLFKNERNAAIYYSQNATMKKIDQNIMQYVKNKNNSVKGGSLEIQGFGMLVNGSLKQLGGLDVNHVVVFPALSSIVLKFNKIRELSAEEVETFIEKEVDAEGLKEKCQTQVINLLGKANFSHLEPGPWIVWVDQYGVLTYLYRVWIKSDQKTELKLEKLMNFKKIKVNVDKKNKTGKDNPYNRK